MKSVLPLITTAALAGLATAVSIPPSRRQTDSDFFFAEYDLDRPAGPGFETCTDDDCESGTWRAIPDNEGGNDICLDFSANEVGYRIAGDDSSKVLYKCDNDAQPLIVHYFPNQFDMGVFWVHSTSQSWASQSSSKRDFEPLPFNSGVVSAVNVDCEFGMALSINVTDANGAVTSVNGTDEIRIDVPQALPANVTVAIDNGDSGFAEMLITGKEKVLVSFGGGEEPTISTGYDLQLQVCPD